MSLHPLSDGDDNGGAVGSTTRLAVGDAKRDSRKHDADGRLWGEWWE